jgi:hypothetical protein
MMPEKIKADEQLKAFSTAKQAELEKLATASSRCSKISTRRS